jgi:hypothetical protein
MTVDQETALAGIDAEATRAFAGRFVGILNDAATALLTSVGHQTGLFETLAALPAATSQQIADAGRLDERYVREWLGGMTGAHVTCYDSVTGTYWLPREHAAVLTSAAGPDNMAILMQHISMMGEVEQKIIERFRHGSGLSYADYPHFHRNMAETSAAVHDAALLDVILPLAPELPGRLRAGIDVADVGCGSGHAINLMAQAFPASRFTGYDFLRGSHSRGPCRGRQLGAGQRELRGNRRRISGRRGLLRHRDRLRRHPRPGPSGCGPAQRPSGAATRRNVPDGGHQGFQQGGGQHRNPLGHLPVCHLDFPLHERLARA